MRRAFTIMEILSVVAILAVLAGLSAPFWRNFLLKNDLYIAEEQTEQMLRRANILAQSGDTGAWGVYVPGGVLYQGTSYANRNPALDEVLLLPNTISVSGIQDVSFSTLYGSPSTSGEIILETINGDEVRINITELFGEPSAPVSNVPDSTFTVQFVELINQGKGSATPTVHVGPAGTLYQNNEVIQLTDHGVVLTDTGFVVGASGIAIQRFDGYFFVLAHGDLGENGGKEIIDARIALTNATITDVQNTSLEFPTENPFDGNVNNGVGGDEVTQEGSSSVLFQSRTTNYGDSITVYWEPAQVRSPWQ